MREGEGSARLELAVLQGVLSEAAIIRVWTVNIDAQGNLYYISPYICTDLKIIGPRIVYIASNSANSINIDDIRGR